MSQLDIGGTWISTTSLPQEIFIFSSTATGVGNILGTNAGEYWTNGNLVTSWATTGLVTNVGPNTFTVSPNGVITGGNFIVNSDLSTAQWNGSTFTLQPLISKPLTSLPGQTSLDIAGTWVSTSSPQEMFIFSSTATGVGNIIGTNSTDWSWITTGLVTNVASVGPNTFTVSPDGIDIGTYFIANGNIPGSSTAQWNGLTLTLQPIGTTTVKPASMPIIVIIVIILCIICIVIGFMNLKPKKR